MKEDLIRQIAKLCCAACEMEDNDSNGTWNCINRCDEPCSIATDLATKIYDSVLESIIFENKSLDKELEE